MLGMLWMAFGSIMKAIGEGKENSHNYDKRQQAISEGKQYYYDTVGYMKDVNTNHIIEEDLFKSSNYGRKVTVEWDQWHKHKLSETIEPLGADKWWHDELEHSRKSYTVVRHPYYVYADWWNTVHPRELEHEKQGHGHFAKYKPRKLVKLEENIKKYSHIPGQKFVDVNNINKIYVMRYIEHEQLVVSLEGKVIMPFNPKIFGKRENYSKFLLKPEEKWRQFNAADYDKYSPEYLLYEAVKDDVYDYQYKHEFCYID